MPYYAFEYEWEREPQGPSDEGDMVILDVTCRTWTEEYNYSRPMGISHVNYEAIEILQVFVPDGTEMRHPTDDLLVDLALYAKDFVIHG